MLKTKNLLIPIHKDCKADSFILRRLKPDKYFSRLVCKSCIGIFSRWEFVPYSIYCDQIFRFSQNKTKTPSFISQLNIKLDETVWIEDFNKGGANRLVCCAIKNNAPVSFVVCNLVD